MQQIAVAISQDTGLSVSTIQNKIYSGHFSREEMLVIASYFEMTPKEFCDVFLNGLFYENELGHYTAHIESAYEVLHPPKGKSYSEKKREKREADLEQVLSQIDAL